VYKKNFLLFLRGLLLCFLDTFLNKNTASAAVLEVSYPTISQSPVSVVTPGTSLPEFAVYLFYLGMGLGFFAVFISLVIAGAMYVLSPISPSGEFLARAKDRAVGAITGLLVLILTYLIVVTINPQLSVFKFNKLSDVESPPLEEKNIGVYLSQQIGCPNQTDSKISSVPDLGQQKNNVRSVSFSRTNNVAFISVLYEIINFKGRCQYINPNRECTDVSPFAASASVHQYDFAPNGDGVYLFRKSFFDRKGGYIKIKNSDIRGIYMEKLSDLKFKDPSCKNEDNPDGCCVPKEEQNCIKYEKDGTCLLKNRVCPSAGGEEISSIGINGNYLVLLVYFDQKDNPEGPWTACQSFPTTEDVNKLGPQQIKWEHVRNSEGVVPNYIVVIPVKQK